MKKTFALWLDSKRHEKNHSYGQYPQLLLFDRCGYGLISCNDVTLEDLLTHYKTVHWALEFQVQLVTEMWNAFIQESVNV